MSVFRDILRSWKAPRTIVRGLLAQGQREDRAIAYLMIGCLLIFIAQLPRLARTAHLEDIGLDRLVAYEFLAWLIVWPLAFYGLAALSHLAAKLLGGRGDWFSARLALFWALLAATPAALLYGLTTGLIGPGPQAALTGSIWLLGLAWIWISGLIEAETQEAAL